MIKQLLNSAIAKYRDLSVARRSIICLCLRHRQIIDLLATDKSRYFAQSRPIIVYYYACMQSHYRSNYCRCLTRIHRRRFDLKEKKTEYYLER